MKKCRYLAWLGAAALLLLPAAASAQNPSPLVGWDDNVGDTTYHEMFQIPEFSPSTSDFIVANSGSSTYDNNNAWPDAELATDGAGALRIFFKWVDETELGSWVRLTTNQGNVWPNPSVHIDGTVSFKITNFSEVIRGNIGLVLGVRETGVAVPQMSDGGTSGEIEWIGVDMTPNGITAGEDMIVDTEADSESDDIQEYPLGTDIGETGLDLPPGTAIISPGPDGILDTTPTTDDEIRAGYTLGTAGNKVPVPQYILPVGGGAKSITFDLDTGHIIVDSSDLGGGIVGFTGDGVLDVDPPRGTLEHIAFVNVVDDLAVTIDVAIDELQFDAPDPDPIPRPTVVSPILPDATTVTVEDVDSTATLVTLKVDNGTDPDQTVDPAGADSVDFTLPHGATAGDTYTATQTINSQESSESEGVRVAPPMPAIGLLPAAGDATVRVTWLDSASDNVVVYVNDSPVGNIDPDGEFSVDVPVSGLTMGDEVYATQEASGAASDPSATVIVTTDTIATATFFDNFEYTNQAAFNLVWEADTAGSDIQLVLDDTWNATPTTGAEKAAYSDDTGSGVAANRSLLITPFTSVAGSDTEPLIWNISFYDDASNYGLFRQWTELRGDGGEIVTLGKTNSMLGSYYSGRCLSGGPSETSGWFVMNDPGAPTTSNGWHVLTAAIKTNTIDYYVDGILAKQNMPRTAGLEFTNATIGSGYSSNGGGAWYDDYTVATGALHFNTITPQPPEAPTVVAPIIPGASQVTVTGIDPAATWVQLYRSGVTDEGVDPISTSVTLDIFPAAATGQYFTATQTVDGLTSPESEAVYVLLPGPTMYKAPAAGEESVTVIIDPDATEVRVKVNDTVVNTVTPTLGETRCDVSIPALVQGDLVTAAMTVGGVDSVDATVETTTTATTTVIVGDDFEDDQATYEAAWPTVYGNRLDLNTDRNATDDPSAVQSVHSPAYEANRIARTFAETVPTLEEPVVWNFHFYDPVGVDTAYDFQGFAQLNGDLTTDWWLCEVGAYDSGYTSGATYDIRLNGNGGPDWIDLDEYEAPQRSIGWHTFTIVHKGQLMDVYVDGLLSLKNLQLTADTTYEVARVGSAYTGGSAYDRYYDDYWAEIGPVRFEPIGPQPPAEPAISAPIEDGDETVTVENVSSDVTLVEIYDATPELIGYSTTAPDENGEVVVTLTRPLVHLESITAEATNTVGTEASNPLEVGAGNGDVLICIGIRETGDTGALGSEGSTSGEYEIEWVGATGVVNGAPQGVAVSPSNSWQTLTFDPTGTDIVGFTGDDEITATRGTLEHLAIAVDAASAERSTGLYELYVDNVVNVEADGGSDFVIADFESNTVGDEVLFQEPTYSGSTGGDMVSLPSASEVSDTEGNPGQSELLVWFWLDSTDQRWARIVTGGAGFTPSPIIDLTKPIRMDILLRASDEEDCHGDSNCDGEINFDDIDYFVAALVGEQNWNDLHGGNPTCNYIGSNDCDWNDMVNFDDIDPFVAGLVDGNCIQPPE